jgi:hypothetical protein
MTTTPDQSRLSDIGRSLNRYEWRPTDAETRCGDAFFHLVKGMEEKEHGFPRRPGRWTLTLHTENVAVLAGQVAVLQGEFLPAWRQRLPADSPMAELIDLYIEGAQPVVRHADAVLAAWAEAALPEPSDDDVAHHSGYSAVPAKDVTAQLRFGIAATWEEEPPRGLLWEQMAPAWNYLGAVRSTLMAAVSGRVEY